MFSCLAKGVGSWNGEAALQQQNTARDADQESVTASSLNFYNGIHRHGITISSHSISTTAKIENKELFLPRTYTTRKGALMLFADDGNSAFSESSYLQNSSKVSRIRLLQEIEDFGSLSRLSSSVLMFGDQEYDDETCSISDPENKAVLKFLKRLDDADIDLSVQPGRNTGEYLRNLKMRLLRAQFKAGDTGSIGRPRLVQSTSALSGLQTQDLSQEFDIQKKFDLPSIKRDKRKTDNTGILPFDSFSLTQPSSSRDPVNAGHDDPRSPLVPISRQTSPIHVQTPCTPTNVHTPDQLISSQPQSGIGSICINSTNKRPVTNFSRSLDLDSDEDNDALDLAYGQLKEYCRDGQSMEGDHLDDSVDGVHPFMPAYDPIYDSLPSISKSFPLEISRALMSSTPNSKGASACFSRATFHFDLENKSQDRTSALHVPHKRCVEPAVVRKTRSADFYARTKKSTDRTPRTPRTRVKESPEETAATEKHAKKQIKAVSEDKSDAAKNVSKSLSISQMRPLSGQEKKQEATVVRQIEESEKVQKQSLKDNELRVDLLQMEDPEEAKRVSPSARTKFKRTKAKKRAGENNELGNKSETDKAAVRESRRKDSEMKKLIAEGQLAEEQQLAEAKRLAEAQRLEEEEKLMEKREKEEEDIAALASKEAKIEEDIEEAQRRIEEAREAEEAARNALAATWKAARQHREAQRRANIERRRQKLLEKTLKEKQRIEAAKRKEQEMLEKIGSSEEVRRFKEAERLRKEEFEHSCTLKLEEEERLAIIAFEKEEERYIEMECEAEEAAMAKLVQERLDAERLPELLKEKQRKLKIEGLKKKNALLADNQEREEKLKMMEKERDRLEEEAKKKLMEMKRLEEEALENAQRLREARRSAAAQRRDQNVENSNHLELLRHDQSSHNQPWVFSYYVHWPRETYGKLIGQVPKKPGSGQLRHSARSSRNK